MSQNPSSQINCLRATESIWRSSSLR